MDFEILSSFAFGRALAQDKNGFFHVKRENDQLMPAYEARYTKIYAYEHYFGEALALVGTNGEFFFINQVGNRAEEKSSLTLMKSFTRLFSD